MVGKKSLKNITVRVLESLFNATEDIAELMTSKQATYRDLLYKHKDYEWTEGKLGKWINNLKRDGYIQIEESTGRKSIEFTNKGKLKIAKEISSKIVSGKRNYFVSFDIPEVQRKERNNFRKILKEIGFKQIQQSLWVANKNVGDLVEIAAREYGVERCFVHIASEESDIDGVIDKMFMKE